MKIYIVSLLFVIGAFPASAKDPERIETADGRTIINAFYDNGTVKTVTRLNPDGSVLGILYLSSKGVATHTDFYDARKRVRRTLYYRPDGEPKSAKEFDEHGKVVLRQEYDDAGTLTRETKVR